MNNNETARHVLNEISGELIKNQRRMVLQAEKQNLKRQPGRKSPLFQRIAIVIFWILEISAVVLAVVYGAQIIDFVKKIWMAE